MQMVLRIILAEIECVRRGKKQSKIERKRKMQRERAHADINVWCQ